MYDPDKFREFCISAGAKKLFDTLLAAMTTPRQSTDRTELNKKRVVSVIYNMCYCLSQICNPLQIDFALYLRSSHINQEGMETEHIMGHSCARRTVNNIIQTMAETHFQSFEHFVTEAIEHKWLLVLVIDDYTSVHSKRRPLNEKPSEAKTMCTMVVKAFNIPAISVEQANVIHDVNGIDIESCQGVITSASCMHDISQTYASQMPDWLTQAFFDPDLQRQRINTHQNCKSDNVRTMRKMDNLHLLDFVELRLKSIHDFEAAYDIVLSTGLAAYMRKFVLLQPGDWPCQFYCRQIIYQCLNKFSSCAPGLTSALQEHPRICDDHSSYSYPTDSHIHTTIPGSTNQQPSILSIVPTIGPLHISLNSREHIVNSFHPFFKSVYQAIFPSSKLADKPKPWRVSLILEIVYGGWTLIRRTVMHKFSQFKDVQYGTLLNLLDNYIPLVLSIYSISFKLNHFSEYFRAIIRIWIMFTCLRRRHYNKTPLVWINMCLHWGKYSPHLYELLRKYITIFDEYPVENTHSILRAQTKSSDTADQLRKKAKAIFQSKEKQSNFRSFFTSPKQFSFSHSQLQFLKVKCAQVLSLMFKKIAQAPGESSFSSSRNNATTRNPSHVSLPTMCSNIPTKTTVLPLGYHCNIKPDPTKKCDLPECKISSPDESWKILTGCFHSFHCKCLNESTSCPLCKDFLQEKVQELGQIAKEAILHPSSIMDDSNETTAPVTDDAHDEDTCSNGVREMEREEFENIIEQLNNELANLNPPQQPCITSNTSRELTQNTNSSASKAPPHCTKCHHPVRGHKRANSSVTKCNLCPNNTCTVRAISSQCSCQWHQQQQQEVNQHRSNPSATAPVQRQQQQQQANQRQPANKPQSTPSATTPVQHTCITVVANQHFDVSEWLLPNYLSQSTIGGRVGGSNACTVIALLTRRHFLEGTLPIPNQLKDLNQTIPIYSQLIFKGNHIYSTFNLPAQQLNLDAQNVLQQNHEEFQKIQIDVDTGFVSTQDLEDFLAQYHNQHPKFAAVLIVPPDKSMLLCFNQRSISLFESHTHGL